MTGSTMTPELMAKAINVAKSVRIKSWVPKKGIFTVSNQAAAKATCEVLDIDTRWEILIYYSIYLPTRSLEEWAEEIVYKDSDLSWGKEH